MTKLRQSSSVRPEISLAYLHDIADGSNEFMVEMIDIFLNQTPAYLNQIEQAILEKDWLTVAEISHKVRPTFAFIGVKEAIDVMASIENYARSGTNLEKVAEEFNQFKPMSAELFDRLIQIRNELDT